MDHQRLPRKLQIHSRRAAVHQIGMPDQNVALPRVKVLRRNAAFLDRLLDARLVLFVVRRIPAPANAKARVSLDPCCAGAQLATARNAIMRGKPDVTSNSFLLAYGQAIHIQYKARLRHIRSSSREEPSGALHWNSLDATARLNHPFKTAGVLYPSGSRATADRPPRHAIRTLAPAELSNNSAGFGYLFSGPSLYPKPITQVRGDGAPSLTSRRFPWPQSSLTA